MIPETRKAIVSPGRIGEAPNRASRYPSRHSNNLPRNPRSRSPAPKRTRAATATLRCSPKSESLPSLRTGLSGLLAANSPGEDRCMVFTRRRIWPRRRAGREYAAHQ